MKKPFERSEQKAARKKVAEVPLIVEFSIKNIHRIFKSHSEGTHAIQKDHKLRLRVNISFLDCFLSDG